MSLKRFKRLVHVREILQKMERAAVAEAESHVHKGQMAVRVQEDFAREIVDNSRTAMSGSTSVTELEALAQLRSAQARTLETARAAVRAASEKAVVARVRLAKAEKNVEIAEGLVTRSKQELASAETKVMESLVISAYARKKAV